MRKILLAATVAVALGWASPAVADVIQFDPDGGGPLTAVDAETFDWQPGNSLLMIDPNDPTSGQILFQANLGVITAPDGVGGTEATFANGTLGGGNFITVVASLDVTLTGGGNFTVNPDTGVFKIYHDTDGGNNLLGTGFTTDAGATEILSGTAIIGAGGLNLLVNDPVEDLDQFVGTAPTNDYPTTDTQISETGSSSVVVDVDTFNALWFTDLIAGSTFTITSTKGLLPFLQTEPSAQFSIDAIVDGGTPGAGTIALCGPGQLNTLASPCINGTGFNIMAESDASTVFRLTPSVVPEPATLTLLGFGLAGAAAARRRRMKASK